LMLDKDLTTMYLFPKVILISLGVFSGIKFS